jgi:hypothetical protein
MRYRPEAEDMLGNAPSLSSKISVGKNIECNVAPLGDRVAESGPDIEPGGRFLVSLDV